MNKETLLRFIFRRAQSNGFLRATLSRLAIEMLHHTAWRENERAYSPLTAFGSERATRGLLTDAKCHRAYGHSFTLDIWR